jgi:hypothetical protein
MAFPPVPFLDQTGTENGPGQSVHRLLAKAYVVCVVPVKRLTEVTLAAGQKIR